MRRAARNLSRACILLAGTLAGDALAIAQTQDRMDQAMLYELAKQEGGLVWYESCPLEAMQGVARDFQSAYPGINVTVQRIVGVAQYQRFVMETQAKQYIADVLSISDEPSMVDLASRGLLADWKVPTHDRIPPEMRLGTSVYAGYINDNIIVYNVNKVTPEEIHLLSQSWKGLLDPRFKGRIAITDQKCGACYSAVHMFLDPKLKEEYGTGFLEAPAAQKPAVYSDIVTVVDRVVSGEQAIGVWPAEGVAFTKWVDGAPIRWTRPKPTPVYGANWQAVSNSAPHPNAARLFQNWSMGEDGIRAIQQRYGGIVTLTGVADERPIAKEGWYPTISVRYVPDWDRWTNNFDADMAQWSKILKAGR
jgi:iron(III) transport system substrate-binding protein